MRQGFSLVEVILGLLLLQLGILAAFGMVLLSQRSFNRADVTLRGVLEAGWMADSIFAVGGSGAGSQRHPWGELSWSAESSPVPGLRFTVWSPVHGDTLVRWFAPSPVRSSPPAVPFPASGGLR